MLQLIGLVVVVGVVGWLVVTLWPVLLFLALCGGILWLAGVVLGLVFGMLEQGTDETVEEWMQRRHPDVLRRNSEAVAKWRKTNGRS
jgi:hypothetical protein